MSYLTIANTGLMTAEKDREFFCPVCRARCTEGTEGVEYGHYSGCPHRPDHLPASTGNYYDPEKGEVIR